MPACAQEPSSLGVCLKPARSCASPPHRARVFLEAQASPGQWLALVATRGVSRPPARWAAVMNDVIG